jgi:hypothetical protein
LNRGNISSFLDECGILRASYGRIMAGQQQREWNVALSISQLAALLLLPLLLVPSGREILKHISAFLLGGIILALVVGVLIVIIRKTARHPRYP